MKRDGRLRDLLEITEKMSSTKTDAPSQAKKSKLPPNEINY
jgi:hypothetical protein